MVPAVLLAASAFVPGRRIARGIAATFALFMPFMGEAGPRWPIGAGWALLWAGVAWRAGAGGRAVRNRVAARPGGAESGMVGLLLGLVLLALLVGAVARQGLSPEAGRRASYGLLIMCLGLLHLMLRRDALRATVAFAALGLGLQVLAAAARATLLAPEAHDPGHVLVATAVAVALADRLARVRQQDAGSAWVSDAHDLHD
jgi:hypothetical protein